MKNVLMALAALPLMAGVATAGQLSDRQMDQVTAGFTALSIADAQGLVGESGIVLVTTATVSQVLPIATATVGETRSSLFKSLSAAQSSTVTSTYNPVPIPGLGG
jgi:fructose-specific phosphotransferase system IIC component